MASQNAQQSANTIKQYNAKTVSGNASPKDVTGQNADSTKAIADVAGKQGEADKKANTTSAQIAQKASETKEELARQQAEAKKEEDRLRDEQEQQANMQEKIAVLADKTMADVNEKTKPYLTWFSSLPTPGGILLLVLVLMFFLFAVTPVNKAGDTRLKLLWLTLTGKTQLNYANNPATSGNGASGQFGSTTASDNGNTTIQTPNIDIFSILNEGLL